MDALHRLAKAVDLRLALALRGLDHERTCHGPAHRRRMVAEVHQPLRHVFDGHLVEMAEVEDALVCHEALGAFVERGKIRFQLPGDVVGVEDGVLGRISEARPHHGDVHPRDGADAGAAPGGGAHRTFTAVRPPGVVPWQMLAQMRGYSNRTNARPATPMRNAEGLVQIQMADIRTDAPWRGQPHLRIHVGTVHVHLPAVVMHQTTDFDDGLFKHAMRGRIGDHESGHLVFAGLQLRRQIIHRNVALVVTRHGHDFEAAHDRAGRVRAMR